MIILLLLISPILILLFLIIQKRIKYIQLLNTFDLNKKEIDKIELVDYKLGSGHIYE